MKNEYVYLTFKTDRNTSDKLKQIAKGIGATQPEVINDACKFFIETIDEACKEKFQEIANATKKDPRWGLFNAQ